MTERFIFYHPQVFGDAVHLIASAVEQYQLFYFFRMICCNNTGDSTTHRITHHIKRIQVKRVEHKAEKVMIVLYIIRFVFILREVRKSETGYVIADNPKLVFHHGSQLMKV